MDECKQRLPLPALMSKLGFGEEYQKASCRSPFRDDKNPSFGIFRHEDKWFFKDHGTDESGDEVTFIEKALGISQRDAILKYKELAGVDDKPLKSKFLSESYEHPWQECVRQVTDKDIYELALWRMYRTDFCKWLKDRRLIGIKDGCLSLPITVGEINMGRWQFEFVTGIHQRKPDGTWRIYGGSMQPMVIEGSEVPTKQLIFESQWDAFALLDCLGDLKDTRIIITRGASNGNLVVPFNVPLPTTLVMQNDQEKNGKVPAEQWAAKIEATLNKAPTHKIYPPKEYKDLNDWTVAMHEGDTLKGDNFSVLREWLNTKPETTVKKNGKVDWDTALFWNAEEDPSALLGKRWLCEGGSCLWIGGSGIGKSVLTIQAAITWSIQASFFGIEPWKELKSTIIQSENDFGDVAESMQGIIQGMSYEKNYPKIKENVNVYTVNGVYGLEFLDRVREIIDEEPTDCVWIDNLLSYLDGEVNDQAAVMAFLNPLRELAIERQVIIHLIHHTGKPRTDTKATANWGANEWAYAGLGSSALTNWARAVMVLVSHPGEDRKFSLYATKRGTRAGMKTFTGEYTTKVPLKHSNYGLCWEEDLEVL